jgi:pimeloyl-ACP methyl ester carboxylesterase
MTLGVLTLAGLMWDYLKGTRGPRPQVGETVLDRSEDGYPLILYVNKATIRSTVVLVHGVTACGSEDPNLVHLARCIATKGYRCLTPSLMGLAKFRHAASDIDIVTSAFRKARDMSGGPVGVLAFSYGASYALSAAAQPAARGCCGAILAFGAYYLLSEALEHQRLLLAQNRNPNLDDTDLLYLRYTLLACYLSELGLSEHAKREIEAALADFMSPAPLEDKKRALLEHAREFDYVELMQRYQRNRLPTILSPAGQLHEIACPVALLHDPNDHFVPADHVDHICRDLDQRVGLAPTLALKTPMLSHVRVNPVRNLRDAWQLVRLLKPVFDPALDG